MSKEETGGPAFPEKRRVYSSGYATNDFEPIGGMTLRDYFAAKALQGFCANPEFMSISSDTTVSLAYTRADAMLEARKK